MISLLVVNFEKNIAFPDSTQSPNTWISRLKDLHSVLTCVGHACELNRVPRQLVFFPAHRLLPEAEYPALNQAQTARGITWKWKDGPHFLSEFVPAGIQSDDVFLVHRCRPPRPSAFYSLQFRDGKLINFSPSAYHGVDDSIAHLH